MKAKATGESGYVPRFFTVPSIARMTGINDRIIREAIDRRELRAVVTSPRGWPRVAESDFLKWLRSLEPPPIRKGSCPQTPDHRPNDGVRT